MANPFDYVNAINFNKQDLMTGTENDELAEAAYVPFLANRSLSNFPDTILYANEMNKHNHLDNKLQFHYLINSIRPKKRFSKWAKRQDSEDFEAVKEYFKYNNTKTEQALQLLTPDQIKTIKKKLNTGGLK
ncbi:clamp loader small subunit [uncultured Caudovirales phage]|uniref:Clamp loader small subunit n=1 Tax=uncultured Caudovirales phage TaxID=2100421 RepID=A0A6J5MAS5_9CAUD|nr:clamp loader small subunit [uncultured Caudovirales phage]